MEPARNHEAIVAVRWRLDSAIGKGVFVTEPDPSVEVRNPRVADDQGWEVDARICLPDDLPAAAADDLDLRRVPQHAANEATAWPHLPARASVCGGRAGGADRPNAVACPAASA